MMMDTVRHLNKLDIQGIKIHMLHILKDTALEKIYNKELIDKKSSEEMISILKNQRLNGKIPFFLQSIKPKIEIAHKTGEDTNITHDVGIVFDKEPFILIVHLVEALSLQTISLTSGHIVLNHFVIFQNSLLF